MKEKIRILIVDDHKVVREGLKAFISPLPQFEIIGEAQDGIEAIAEADKLQPDVILMDLLMPKMDGIEATQAIKQKFPNIQILILTSFSDEEQVITAIRAGASGYLLKDSSPNELKKAILDVYRGESAIPTHIASILMRELNRAQEETQPTHLLSERELELLIMVAQGLTNQVISEQLTISVWTVRTHITHILKKLKIENRTQATLYALREGLVDLEKPQNSCELQY